MKKSLSLFTALTTVVLSVPLSFADSMSSTSSMSSVMSSSSSSASSAMMMDACNGKKGIEKVLCMNAESRKKNTPTAPNRMTSRAKESMDACKAMMGTQKSTCVHTAMKNTMMAKKRMTNTIIPQSKALNACSGKRGGALATCFQNMEMKAMHSMMKKSSSSTMSTSSASSN